MKVRLSRLSSGRACVGGGDVITSSTSNCRWRSCRGHLRQFDWALVLYQDSYRLHHHARIKFLRKHLIRRNKAHANSIRTTARDNAAAPARILGSSARSPSRRSVGESTRLARDRARNGRPPQDSARAYVCGHQPLAHFTGHGDMVTRLARSFTNDHFETERADLTNASDLDHGNLLVKNWRAGGPR